MRPDHGSRCQRPRQRNSARQRARLPYLVAAELRLYEHLVDRAAADGVGLLLEQERIPWQHAYPILRAAIEAQRHPVSNLVGVRDEVDRLG
jgi:hypothetical protein